MAKSKVRVVADDEASAAPLVSFQDILMYKGVWALCTYNEKKEELRATHIAIYLVGGRDPMWGVWLLKEGGLKFLRFAATRSQIERAYPQLTWRRKMSPFQLQALDDVKLDVRRANLTEKYAV